MSHLDQKTLKLPLDFPITIGAEQFYEESFTCRMQLSIKAVEKRPIDSNSYRSVSFCSHTENAKLNKGYSELRTKGSQFIS